MCWTAEITLQNWAQGNKKQDNVSEVQLAVGAADIVLCPKIAYN